MDCLRRGGQQISDHEITLGDPRAFVEQPRGFIERFEIEPDQRGAERGPARERVAVRFLRSLVTEEDQLALARHAEPETSGKRRHLRQRPVTRIGSVVIASPAVSETTDPQASARHPGTTPAVEISPGLAFSPTMLLSIAGPRPD